MAKIESTKPKKNTTLQSPGIDFINVMIRLFILGIALIDLSGLNILSMRSTLITPESTLGMKSTMLTNTTKKSSQFQVSRR